MKKQIAFFVFVTLVQPTASYADQNAGLLDFGTKFWMAQECGIKIRPDVMAWLETLGSEIPKETVAALRPTVEKNVKNSFATDGKVSSCLSLRGTLHRDGWL